NLKTVQFGEDDVSAMQAAISDPALKKEDRFHLHFALGKAAEEKGEAEASFDHYAEGNRLRRSLLDYSADDMHSHVARCIGLFTTGFFAAREGCGNPSPDPIVIVGMPRAGSTLIEQILASHPDIEGTAELP